MDDLFKADKESINLSGGSICFFTPGNHGNLGVWDVDPGAVISIPDSLGNISFGVTPLELGNRVFDPVVGVVIVLMKDGGHVTPHGISAGHEAFNQGAKAAIDDLVKQTVLNLGPLPQQQVDQIIAAANLPQVVANAVINAQSTCENVWALSGKDSEIGHAIATWDVNAANFGAASQTRNFVIEIPESQLSKWKITGSITVSDRCPASASAAALSKVFRSEHLSRRVNESATSDLSTVVELMRDFRKRKAILAKTSFNDWWNLAKRHTPELSYLLATRRDAQKRLRPLINALVEHCGDAKRADGKTSQALTIDSRSRIASRAGPPKFREETFRRSGRGERVERVSA